jgi:hypothetical protein
MKSALYEKTREALKGGKVIGDGHTIYNPTFYAPYFTEEELREAGLIRRYSSDTSSHKSTIFDPENGEVVDYVDGVYNLTFLTWLAAELGVKEYRECFGRGSQAQVIVSAIMEVMDF